MGGTEHFVYFPIKWMINLCIIGLHWPIPVSRRNTIMWRDQWWYLFGMLHADLSMNNIKYDRKAKNVVNIIYIGVEMISDFKSNWHTRETGDFGIGGCKTAWQKETSQEKKKNPEENKKANCLVSVIMRRKKWAGTRTEPKKCAESSSTLRILGKFLTCRERCRFYTRTIDVFPGFVQELIYW